MKKIAFVFSTTIGNSGGVKIAFEYANYINKNKLAKVDIVYPIIPGNYRLWKFKSFKNICKFFGTLLFNILKYNCKKYRELYKDVEIVRIVNLNNLKKLEYDVIIGTSWESTYYIKELNCEKKYFVQAYETWDGPAELVQKTYTWDEFRVITISKYLESILKLVHCTTNACVAYNPIYISNVNKVCNKNFKKSVYGIIYRGIPNKSFKLIIEFLKENPIYKNNFICIGQHVPKKFRSYFHKVMNGSKYENMIEFYKEINTLVLLSDNEGFGLPIIEAMSFGNIVISKETGILYDLGIDKENYLKIKCYDNINESFNGVFNKITLEQLKSAIKFYENMDVLKKETMSNNAFEVVSYYMKSINLKDNIEYFIK